MALSPEISTPCMIVLEYAILLLKINRYPADPLGFLMIYLSQVEVVIQNSLSVCLQQACRTTDLPMRLLLLPVLSLFWMQGHAPALGFSCEGHSN